MSARRVATTVLHRVQKDQAYAAPTLDAAITRARLSQRDAALATTIVYDTLRVLPAIDAVIKKRLKRKKTLDPFVQAALRAATYALLHLSRVPPRATVHETVALVRKERGQAVAGFVNAVLRAIARERPEEPERPRAMVLPPWIHETLKRSLSTTQVDAFLAARSSPTVDLCAFEDREAIANAIEEAQPSAQVSLGTVSPYCVRLRGAGDPRALPGYNEGRFFVQEEGSQMIAQYLEARPGETVGDLCAGRGGKTLHLARAVGEQGRVTAVELHEARLDELPKRLARLHIATPVELETIDLTVGAGGLENTFDRVLIDAPCTGLGTLHRRPELMLRLTKHDVSRMAKLQRAIAENALRMLKPGGRLVYAVCSFAKEELPLDELGGIRKEGVEPVVHRLGPWAGGTDAYQVLVTNRPFE